MDADLARRQPQYARIAAELIADIRSGAYAVGTLLPTEPELGRRFAVSRVTIRGALRELELRGLISRRSGIGTRVESAEVPNHFVHESSSVEDILQFTQELSFKLLSRNEIHSAESVPGHFRNLLGDGFTSVEGLRLAVATGTPVCLSRHYVPAVLAPMLERMDGQQGSLATALARAVGEEIDQVEQVIEAVNLDKRQAALLAVRTRDAALSTWRQYRTGSGRLLIASHSLFPKERYSYALCSRRKSLSSAAVSERRLA